MLIACLWLTTIAIFLQCAACAPLLEEVEVRDGRHTGRAGLGA